MVSQRGLVFRWVSDITGMITVAHTCASVRVLVLMYGMSERRSGLLPVAWLVHGADLIVFSTVHPFELLLAAGTTGRASSAS